ncbi:hypothetical protein AC1031_009265 [Aphanomyces cochlioides]|nr:hypothetical protein AC1031_009265 [Aphanomyces cochlioides]
MAYGESKPVALSLPDAMQNPMAKDKLTSEFRRHLVTRVKKAQTVADYRDLRAHVLDTMVSPEPQMDVPRRPKVPRNRRVRQNRIFRRVDRMLKKLWPPEQTNIEESLRDFHIAN